MSIIAESQRMQIIFRRSWVTLGLILALFALRYLLTASHIFFMGGSWVIPVYEVGTYILVATLLIWERRALADYHIPALAIWIIILFRPLETLLYPFVFSKIDSPMVFPKLPSVLVLIIALGLFAYFSSRLFIRGSIHQQDWKWILVGALVGLSIAIIISFPLSLQIGPINPRNREFAFASFVNGLVGIPQQIGYAAVPEEPVFRAFLWGYLRKSGWRDIWIWLFQAGLFSLAHLYYLNSAPISFWFVVPFGGLVLGWLVWRSRSIATSMVAHGVLNSMGSTLAYLVAVFRG